MLFILICAAVVTAVFLLAGFKGVLVLAGACAAVRLLAIVNDNEAAEQERRERVAAGQFKPRHYDD